MTELSFKMTLIRAFALLLVLSLVASEDINITCRDDVSFTSPDYPSNYPNYANKRWFITAPKGHRILVTFTDFNVETDDFLNVADKVDKQSSMRYTGEEMEFPPFLITGNTLTMTFISLESGTRRGFNVSTSCFNNSGDANMARIVGNNSPGKGFLELHTQSDNWRRVCKDSFGERVAEVVCGQLGYPAVKKVSYGTGDCISAGQDCTKAPICNDYTFRLEDCSRSYGNCTSSDAVKVECYEPGYKGCYHPEDLPQQNGYIFESTSQCVSSCRTNTRKALAIMNGKHCFCSIADEVNLPDIAPAADPSTCIQNTRGTRQLINSLVYDVSVGFCDELDDVMNGSWDSNITWFGSIVHLRCNQGYRLNDIGALQCVPGLSPYYPIWNYSSLPTCDMLEGTKWSSTTQTTEVGTNTSSTTSTLNPDDLNGKKNIFVIIFFLIIGLFIVGLILCAVSLSKGSKLKSLASQTGSWITHLPDRLCCQSVAGKEKSETEPENPRSSMGDGQGSPSEPKCRLSMVIQEKSN